MEGEINNFIKVWFSVLVCLSYCYAISKIVSKGPSRLLCVLPIVCIFLFLPLSLHTIDLGGTTAFFIAWLANFKLLMFAFGKGPLCSDPSISLGHFVALASLPIKIQQNTSPKPLEKPQKTQNKINPSPLRSHLNGHKIINPPPKQIEKPKNTKNKSNPSLPISHLNGQNKENITSKQTKEGHISLLNYAIKCILMVIMFRIYDYGDQIHPKLILILYCFHIYFSLEIILAILAAMAQALVGLELEPQFNEPYLSTSLQDFWGRRWNLMVTSIVHVTIYNPTRCSMTHVVGHKWASLFAVFTTFVVSGLMHELIFYYMGRLRPTWEIMCFFLLHGFCLVVEIVLKKSFFIAGSRWRLPCLISGPLTLGFMIITSLWLFFREIMCLFLLHGFCLVVEIVLKKSFFITGSRWRLPCLISGPLTLGFMIITSLWLFFPQYFWTKVDRGFGEYALFYEYLNNVTHSFKEL